jgi:hypothetical protein
VVPAVAERLRGRLRVVPVAPDDVGALDPQFAALAGGLVTSVLVDDADLVGRPTLSGWSTYSWPPMSVTAEVASVIPYPVPEATRPANTSLMRNTISGGMAVAPMPKLRRLDRSRLPNDGASSTSCACSGVPPKAVSRSRSMYSRAFSGSQRYISTSLLRTGRLM